MQVQKGFERSWYALMPHADFKIRNSFYDALTTLCMPVVFEADLVRHLPFTDIVSRRPRVPVTLPSSLLARAMHVNGTLLLWS